jgi:hypothetical protein
MAELGIKIKVDGVETVLKSFNDVETKINDLKKKMNNAEVGGKQFKDLQKELKATENAYTSAQVKNQGFLDSIAKAPGLLGTMGQSIKGLDVGFKALSANPFVAVAGVLALILQKVIEKLSSMEVITDALGKVMGSFGAIVGNIVNAVITPLAEGIAYVIEGMASLMGYFSDNAKAGAEFADKLDAATEAEKENTIALAASNAAMAEAREKAADVTLSTAERVKALRDAAKIEKELTDQSIKINTDKLKASLGLIATELGARKELIAQIQNGSLEEIKAARASLLAMKNVDKDKIYALDQMIIAIEDSKAKSAKIQTKTDKQAEAIEIQAANDAAQRAKDAEAKRLERIKKANDAKIKELDASIANEIAREDTRSKELRVLLDARMKFDLEGVKKGSELEAKIKREYAEKATQALDTDFKKRSADTLKALAEENKEIAKAGEKQLAINQEIRDKEFNEIQLALSKQQITEEEARRRTFEAAKKQGELDLQLLRDNKQKEIDALDAVKDKLTGEEFLKEKEKITEKYEGKITEKTKTNNKLVLDNTLATNKEIAASNKQLLEDRLAILDLEFSNEFTSYDRRIAIIKEKEAALLANTALTADARKKIEIETSQAISEQFLAERQDYIDATNMAADASAQLAAVFGEETEAGQALLKVQEALNLATQIASFVTQIQSLAKRADAQATQQSALAKSSDTIATTGNTIATAGNTASSAGNAIVSTVAAGGNTAKGAGKLPFPASLIAVIAVIATFVGIIASIKSLLSKGKEAEKEFGGAGGGGSSAAKAIGSTFAEGGLLDGPSHSQGGIKTSFGELEGGEYVVNKRATQSFLPILAAINSTGNRKYQDGGMMANMDTIQAMMASQPSPIVKTYVVASDMTSQQEANKKLMDLAKI